MTRSLFLLCAIGCLHLLGVFFLYDRWTYYDIGMHTGTGFILSYVLYQPARRYFSTVGQRYYVVFTSLVLLGVIWEFGEFTWDHTIGQWFGQSALQLSQTDTMKDLLMDMVGSGLFVWWYRRRDLTE